MNTNVYIIHWRSLDYCLQRNVFSTRQAADTFREVISPIYKVLATETSEKNPEVHS